MPIIRVALDVPVHSLFDYIADDASSDDIGRRVLVSFGQRSVIGVIIEVNTHSDIKASKLKKVTTILRDAAPLPPDILALLRFTSDYYHHPFGQVVLNALPGKMRSTEAIPPLRKVFYKFSELGMAVEATAFSTRATIKHKLLQHLKTGPIAHSALNEISPRALPVLREWISCGWVEQMDALEQESAPAFIAPFALTREQQSVLQDLEAYRNTFQTVLLHGVTGSGKTEIYLQLAAKVLQSAQQVLILVPEINLTPQLEQLFRSRFPQSNLVSLHSGLNQTERLQNWLSATNGHADIVLGTRLAVFTPMPKLGLIIIDEEHDSSFKQQDGLRYSARDVAIYRAKAKNIPIILGTATPALETYAHAQAGRYRLLPMTQRAFENARLPQIRCVNTKLDKVVNGGLSATLIEAIGQRLSRGEQSLIFINRRGYAPAMLCSACAWSAQCSRCTARLVVHLQQRKLRCHHCGYECRIPHACPDCGNQDLLPVGQGTQRLEAALNELFPVARVLRIDRDSTRRKDAWPKMLKQIQDGEADILVGTQMLAKGHDFAQLSLVGVLGADNALYSADFRASERLFAQLMQVSGRAGRADITGEVLIQTDFPDHPLYQALRRHDYNEYAEALLTERKQAGFPPFIHQTLLRAEAIDAKAVMDFLENALTLGNKLGYEVTLYQPVPATMARRAGMSRAHLLVQCEGRKVLHDFLAAWLGEIEKKPTKQVRWSIDVDPADFG